VKRFSWILTLPLIVVAVVFSIANRDPVTLDLWPFDLSLRMPLFAVLLASLVVGLLIGGLAAWLSGAGARRRGRRARRRVEELEREVARLRQESDRATRAGPTAVEGGGRAGLPAAPGSAVDAPGPDKRTAVGR
jgi:uncharacterized integral membrane protein